MMFAIVNNNAVFSIRGREPNFDIDSLSAENAYIENSIPPSYTHEFAQNSQGFVFLQENTASSHSSQAQENSITEPNTTAQIFTKKNPSLKFFSFFSDGNSKGVGEMNLEKNEDCKHL